ncbi:hypothetical protein DCAR_0206003 [Daucus carota subsp. sativus]|uniref:Uncharacterized protein n=1 Tax=Daucus carota subsp. sativus TaxID=79200 RepID=A0A161X0I5_DAUCS|nr:hypothetical protein DCAR_0206003 [Daucus carota subsp. sativus]
MSESREWQLNASEYIHHVISSEALRVMQVTHHQLPSPHRTYRRLTPEIQELQIWLYHLARQEGRGCRYFSPLPLETDPSPGRMLSGDPRI